MHYRWKTGMSAWALFRLTGLALAAYLTIHIIVISNLHSEENFDKTMQFLGAWQFRMLEIGLLLAVIYHAMNGVRIFVIDFFKGALYQAKLFWVMMVVGALLFIAGAYPMFSHALHWKKAQSGSQHSTSAVQTEQAAASAATGGENHD